MGICDDARNKGIDTVNEALDPLINDAVTIIAHMRARNPPLDPTQYYDAQSDRTIDLVAYVADLNQMKADQTQEVNDKVDSDCQGTVDFLQTITDFTVSGLTLGISDLLPRHMSHIDVGEILGGKPLGGPNSALNQLRDGILNGIGIGPTSDLGGPIVNPRRAVEAFLKNFGIHF